MSSEPVRAKLAAAKVKNQDPLGGANPPIAMGINNAGRAVPGAGQSGIGGIVILPTDKAAGDVIDLIDQGEIVEFGGAAGTAYTANTTTGVISAAAASVTQIPVGYTVEADRLVVRI